MLITEQDYLDLPKLTGIKGKVRVFDGTTRGSYIVRFRLPFLTRLLIGTKVCLLIEQHIAKYVDANRPANAHVILFVE